jgi:hypothetical protein
MASEKSVFPKLDPVHRTDESVDASEIFFSRRSAENVPEASSGSTGSFMIGRWIAIDYAGQSWMIVGIGYFLFVWFH